MRLYPSPAPHTTQLKVPRGTVCFRAHQATTLITKRRQQLPCALNLAPLNAHSHAQCRRGTGGKIHFRALVSMDDMWKAKFSTYEKETLQGIDGALALHYPAGRSSCSTHGCEINSVVLFLDNWYEDRIQAPEEVSFLERERYLREQDPDLVEVAGLGQARNMPVPRLTRHRLPGTKRCIPVHVPVSKVRSARAPGYNLRQPATRTTKPPKLVTNRTYPTQAKPYVAAPQDFTTTNQAVHSAESQYTAQLHKPVLVRADVKLT